MYHFDRLLRFRMVLFGDTQTLECWRTSAQCCWNWKACASQSQQNRAYFIYTIPRAAKTLTVTLAAEFRTAKQEEIATENDYQRMLAS